MNKISWRASPAPGSSVNAAHRGVENHSPEIRPSSELTVQALSVTVSNWVLLTLVSQWAKRTPSHACSAGENSVADLLLASDPALLVSAPALALVAGATKLSKMAAQCFLFHLIVLFMPHSKTLINTNDTSSPPSLSVGSLACLWHAGLFDTRLITARGLVVNQGHVKRDWKGPPVFQKIPPLSPISHFRWPVLQVQGWAKGFSFLIN